MYVKEGLNSRGCKGCESKGVESKGAELRGGKEQRRKSVTNCLIRSLEDAWIQPGETVRIEVAAPQSKVTLGKDRIPGICSMELGWRGELAWNQGEKLSKILRTASAEISSQIFQVPGALAGRCLAISNRSTQPIRLKPSQVINEAIVADEEDQEVWTPPPAPAVKKPSGEEGAVVERVETGTEGGSEEQPSTDGEGQGAGSKV